MKIILISLDTLRADHLGCYGYSRGTSPNIDALASQGTRFDRCYAADVPTIPSYTAVFSGQIGTKTGMVSFNPTEKPPDQATWFPVLLARQGYTTAAVSTLLHMGGHFPRGFQYYLNPMAGYRERTQTVEADEINRFVLPWLKAHYQEDFFLFVHYWDPHVDSVWGQEEPRQRYLPPEEYAGLYYEGMPQKLDSREYVVSQYDAEIAYADKCIGNVLNLVDELGIADETLIVFQSDHGENLGEDHPLGRAIWDHLDVHEPTIRIPLIVRYPGLGYGRAIGGLVQNVDISATILSYAQVPVPDVYDGQDLAPLIQGASSTRYAEVYSNQGFMTCKRALITGDGWKLIKSVDNSPYEDAPTTELYDLNRDPGEVNNLAGVETGRLAELELRMARWLEQVLGNRPDPLRLRAHMGMLGPDAPYYGTTYQLRTDKRIYTATPE